MCCDCHKGGEHSSRDPISQVSVERYSDYNPGKVLIWSSDKGYDMGCWKDGSYQTAEYTRLCMLTSYCTVFVM